MLFQDFTRDHPPCRKDVCEISTFTAQRRRSAPWTGHQYLPWYCPPLVEPIWLFIRSSNPQETTSPSAKSLQLEMAFLWGVFEINGETHYLWRAIDHEGEVLEAFVSKRRDRKAALVFLKKIMKRYGRPRAIVTDRLRSYRAAMKLIGNNQIQEVGRWMNNLCENSHLPFRRREYMMLRFRHMRSLQKFISIHSSVFNHFNKERHLNSRDIFKVQREAALFKWQ